MKDNEKNVKAFIKAKELLFNNVMLEMEKYFNDRDWKIRTNDLKFGFAGRVEKEFVFQSKKSRLVKSIYYLTNTFTKNNLQNMTISQLEIVLDYVIYFMEVFDNND